MHSCLWCLGKDTFKSPLSFPMVGLQHFVVRRSTFLCLGFCLPYFWFPVTHFLSLLACFSMNLTSATSRDSCLSNRQWNFHSASLSFGNLIQYWEIHLLPFLLSKKLSLLLAPNFLWKSEQMRLATWIRIPGDETWQLGHLNQVQPMDYLEFLNKTWRGKERKRVMEPA